MFVVELFHNLPLLTFIDFNVAAVCAAALPTAGQAILGDDILSQLTIRRKAKHNQRC
jgi:hypothetical protein